jgi:hypothetical protein
MTKARVNADNASADIQGVTAGTGLTGGGTSGTVTLTNDMATVIDAKGDLVVGTGADTYDNLAAGSNGDTLVADSSTSTGLSYQANWAAGKNKIINGDFRINQRNFTTASTDGAFTFDRWKNGIGTSGGTCTVTPQTFTPGAAPVAGYEGSNFIQLLSASQSGASDWASTYQNIEDVRSLAGQTITVSFWAKATSGTPNIGVTVLQNFGTGGSSSVIYSPSVKAITTSWVRYSFNITLSSLSGKTIGTNSMVQFFIFTSTGSTLTGLGYAAVGLQNNTFQIWGVQVEAGSVATAFQTATGTLQGELAACQRYYYRQTVSTNQPLAPTGGCATAAIADSVLYFPVTMRLNPSSIEVSNVGFYNWGNGSIYESGTITSAAASLYAINLRYTHGSNVFTTGQSGALIGRASTSFIGINAEL